MDRIKVGIIGTGGIFYGWGGYSGHLPAYPKIDEAKLVALCDVNEANLKKALYWTKRTFEEEANKAEEEGDFERAKELKEDVNEIKIYTDYQKMLKEEKLDLVDIITPVRYHAPIAIEFLKKGINVMGEKPMAKSWLECCQIIEAVEKSGKFYQYNENLVYASTWYNLKKFIDTGTIGEVVTIFLPLAINEPGAPTSNYWDPKLSGGGSLMDMAIHGITATWFLLGFDKKPLRVKSAEPYGVSIRMKNRIIDGIYQEIKEEDDAHFLVEYEDKDKSKWVTVYLEGSWSYKDSRDPVVIGTKGSIEFSPGGNSLKIIDVFGNTREVTIWHPDGFLHRHLNLPEPGGFLGEIKNMCNCIIRGIKPLCDERIGAESQAIASTAYLSEMRGRKAVYLKDFKEYALKIKEEEGERASEVLLAKLLSAVK